jgi:hypothetical protein
MNSDKLRNKCSVPQEFSDEKIDGMLELAQQVKE